MFESRYPALNNCMPSRMDCRRMSARSADEIAAGKDKNTGRKLIDDGLKMMRDGRKATMGERTSPWVRYVGQGESALLGAVYRRRKGPHLDVSGHMDCRTSQCPRFRTAGCACVRRDLGALSRSYDEAIVEESKISTLIVGAEIPEKSNLGKTGRIQQIGD